MRQVLLVQQIDTAIAAQITLTMKWKEDRARSRG